MFTKNNIIMGSTLTVAAILFAEFIETRKPHRAPPCTFWSPSSSPPLIMPPTLIIQSPRNDTELPDALNTFRDAASTALSSPDHLPAVLFRGFRKPSFGGNKEGGGGALHNFMADLDADVRTNLETAGGPGVLSIRGRQPRVDFGNGLFRASGVPRPLPIPTHTELAFTSHAARPGLIAFYANAMTTPMWGETPVTDMRAVWTEVKRQDPFLARELAHGSAVYRYTMRTSAAEPGAFPPFPWLFGCDVPSEDRAWGYGIGPHAASQSIGVERTLSDDGRYATYTAVAPWVERDPRSGREALTGTFGASSHRFAGWMYDEWFGNRTTVVERAFWKGVFWAAHNVAWPRFHPDPLVLALRQRDGTERRLTEAEERVIFDAVTACTYLFSWREGDYLVLNNVAGGHARAPVHPEGVRDIQVAYAEVHAPE